MELHTLTKQALEEFDQQFPIEFFVTSMFNVPNPTEFQFVRWQEEETKRAIARRQRCRNNLTSTITRLLEAEIERLEGMKKIDSGKCPECGGDGYLVEADPSDQSGQTPMQVQCHACFATGVIEMPNLDYNKAIDDHIKLIKDDIAKIKEI